jgi:hypothetical protein
MTEFIAAFCVLISVLLLAWAVTASYLAIRFYRAFKCSFEGLMTIKNIIANAQALRAKADLSNVNEVNDWVN